MTPLPFRLVPFETPSTSALDLHISGTLARTADALQLAFALRGVVERVKFAAATAHASRKNELWRTTCFELFVKIPDDARYWEYNLAPSGDWNAYRLAGYRAGLQPETEVADINVETERAGSDLKGLRAALPLPATARNRRLAVGISSVIEDRSGAIHYFALRHGGAKPDFHDPASFTLALDPTTHRT
jgi:hypothetical protein